MPNFFVTTFITGPAMCSAAPAKAPIAPWVSISFGAFSMESAFSPPIADMPSPALKDLYIIPTGTLSIVDNLGAMFHNTCLA